MDDFKIKNFAAEHPGKQLPLKEASNSEVVALKALLLLRLGLPETIDDLALVQAIESKSVPVDGQDASRSGFDLAQLLIDAVGINLEDDVFLNWRRFDQLDRMRAVDLAEFFDDVWYPSADDLDIVDSRCRWVISICHHGGVRVLRLGP